jgi:hypothetical protein
VVLKNLTRKGMIQRKDKDFPEVKEPTDLFYRYDERTAEMFCRAVHPVMLGISREMARYRRPREPF